VKYNPFVTFFLYCPVLFFSFQRPARTALYGSNDVVPPKDGLFGVRTMSDILWEMCPKNSPKSGVNRHFQAKVTKFILKLAYYRNYRINSNQILHSDKDHQTPFVGGPITHKTSKMADGRHLGKSKNRHISAAV